MPESFDRRLSRLETQVDKNEDKIGDIEKEIDDLKEDKHSQALVNQKMNYTLDEINKQREADAKSKERNAKNIKDIKMWILGVVGTIGGSLIIAALRMLLGI